MTNRMLVALTAVMLSAAGAMEAREARVQPQQRHQEPESEQRRPEPERENRSERPSHRVAAGNRPHNNGGLRINPEYFGTHYGYAHGFHFANYAGGACIGDCGLRQFGGEWYFDFNGGWFGIVSPMPGNWAYQTDYLYIGVGGDGNYYLYDAQFPDVAVQLTFVQNIGDDQAGADEDDGDQ
ncbi:MAG: hypothetical protein ABSF64_39610 [Bryobacteraceae bacterium]|jgi:hypothetical protein